MALSNGLLLAGVAFFIVIALGREQEATRESAIQTSETLAYMVEQHVTATLREGDLLARRLGSIQSHPEKSHDWDHLLQEMGEDRRGMVVSLGFADPQGNILRWHGPGLAGTLADLPPPENKGLHMGLAFLDDAGKPILPLARRISNEGRDVGIALVALDGAVLGEFLAGVRIADGASLAVTRADGPMLVRHPFLPDAIGKSSPKSAIWPELKKGPDGHYWAHSTVDGVERAFGFRTSREFPIISVVGISADAAFVPFRKSVLAEGGLALVMGLCILVLTFLVLHQIRSLATQAESLRVRDRALQTSPSGILIADANAPDMPLTYVNPAFERMTGYGPAEVLGRNCRFLQVPGAGGRELDRLREALRDGRDATVELLNRRKDGSLFWNELRVSPVIDERGRLTHYLGIQTDVTERKRAEEAIRASEERFRLLADQVNEMIARHDLDGRRIYVSPASRAILGYEPEELIGREAFEIVHPDDAPRVREWMETAKVGSSTVLDCRARHRDGRWISLEVSARMVVAPDGRREMVSVVRDVTETRRMERELRESEERLRAVTGTAQDGILTADHSGRIVFANPAAERLLGHPPGGLLGRTIEELIPGRRRGGEPGLLSRILAAAKSSQGPVESVALRSDGTELDVEISLGVAPLLGEESVTAIVRDVTARKRMDELVQRAQRLDGIGTLAGGMAHELNNLLHPALTFVRFAMSDVSDRDVPRADAEVMGYLGTVLDSLRQAKEIVHGVLDFARAQPRPKAFLRFGESVDQALSFAAIMAPPGVRFVRRIEDRDSVVGATKTELLQVFTNLVGNAIHAMGGTGTLEVAVKPVPADDPRLPVPGEGRPSLRVTVSDTGHGMDPATVARVFDPFFTLKPVGEGTGLGLSVVYSIIRGWGGTISVESEPGKGTTFIIDVPVITGVLPQHSKSEEFA